MKITLQDNNGTYSVETNPDEETIHEYFERLVIPVLCAAGFNREMIEKYMEA